VPGGLSQTDQTQKVQSTGGNRTDHRTPENRLLHATRLFFWKKRTANQRFDGSNCMKFEKLMEKLKEKILQVIFRLFCPKNFYPVAA